MSFRSVTTRPGAGFRKRARRIVAMPVKPTALRRMRSKVALPPQAERANRSLVAQSGVVAEATFSVEAAESAARVTAERR